MLIAMGNKIVTMMVTPSMTITEITKRSGAQLAAALDFAWTCIQHVHPEIPDVIIVTGRRRSKPEQSIRGQHCTDVWLVEGHDKKLSEVWLAGERLNDGPDQAMGTLLHEAAHALARVRGIKETCNRNRYHNKEFAKLARELGLTPPSCSAGPHLGYSNCIITPETVLLYEDAIDRLRRSGCVVTPEPAEPKKPAKLKRFAACGCEDARLPWSKQMDKYVAQFGAITHQSCRQPYEPEDEED